MAYKNPQNSAGGQTPTPQKKFSRKIEDFRCGECNYSVTGTGYTNHCPNCLHSQHVDVNPGDRASSCKGTMQPVQRGIHSKKGEYIVHTCLKCGYQKKNKISEEDNKEKINQLPW